MSSDDVQQSAVNRRQFLGRSAQRAATVAVGVVGLSSATSVMASGRSANERLGIGVVGIRNQGKLLASELAKLGDVDIRSLCDIDQSLFAPAIHAVTEAGQKAPVVEREFRHLLDDPSLDAIVLAVPDHWHAEMTQLACLAGKDVYVEKPLGISLEQDFAIRREVQRYGRIFQYGTQQRSLGHIRFGCELVRNGRIGKVQSVEVTAPSYGYEGGSLEPLPVPDGFDYDLWLGPAPWRPYTKDRCTCWGAYWIMDYAHGFIGGWGAHPLTDMVWAMGDDAGAVPVEFAGTGKFGSGLFDAPYDWDIHGTFANGASFHLTPGGDCATIIGERGRVVLSRGGLRVEPESLLQEKFGADELHLYESHNHMGNFLDCVRSRRPTVAPAEVAVLSDTITQLSMVAMLTGRKIRWDPVKEVILDDPGAAQLLTRAMRPPWHL